MYFDSFDRRHKSQFGACVSGCSICFFVDDERDGEMFMLRRFGQGEYEYLKMQRTAGGYFIAVNFDVLGVFFYRFLLRTPDGAEHKIYRAPDGKSTNMPPFDWQQTVYSADYDTPDFIKGGIIYQIFPDRFCKADCPLPAQPEDRVYVDWSAEPCFTPGKAGYVINNDYFGGNLRGIEQKLDYLSSLGVTLIYLNPIFEAHSNHRYNTADYMKIDPTLGDEKDFVSLCSSAKKRGIKIILDGVFSHTGSDSVYFNKEGRYDSVGAYSSTSSPYYSWYKFTHFPDKYDSWWGFETLPEVNENDASFCNFITGTGGVIDYWMSHGASGFRLDVADELPDDFIAKIRIAVKRNDPDGLLIGEVWEDASNKVSYGEQRRYLFGDELDGVMNYPFANEIKRFVRHRDGVSFINRIMQICENYPKCALDCMMNLLSTHDTERLITALAGEPCDGRDREWQYRVRLDDSQKRRGQALVRLAAVLQYTLPGVPSVYYGDEQLMEGYRDPFNRGAFDWSRVCDDDELLRFYKNLGAVRRSCTALKTGSFIPAQYDYDCVSFIREQDGEELLVLVNPSDHEVEFWLPPGWEKDEIILGGGERYDTRFKLSPLKFALLGRGKWTANFTDRRY